eukprot:TRINITY_DN5884_c0_g1_i2.p1 TRINITY_DN5884_c0_g1~~TRINITY_DN5884_c0_g1_i2.p1  ORF type:complete len:447 (-),score=86.85 TRINITY_DN5884_c0_g1_i2:10-1308(-)
MDHHQQQQQVHPQTDDTQQTTHVESSTTQQTEKVHSTTTVEETQKSENVKTAPKSPEPSTKTQMKNDTKEEKIPTEQNILGKQPQQEKVDFLVIDSGAIIRSMKLETYGENFLTVPEVVQEIKDKKAKSYLAAFPYKIEYRNPTPQALKAVAEFSKKTGDYGSLSLTDLKILALVYTLEAEINGIDKIRTEPTVQRPKEEPRAKTVDLSVLNPSQVVVNKDKLPGFGSDDGWITSDNIDIYTQSLLGAKILDAETKVETQGKKVACVTFDFAMQNILLQMNLNLLSPNGFHIKKVSQYALKCYSCFKICKDTDQLFCPNCGNATFVKVSYTVDESGNVVYQQVGRISLRGSIYSIPRPKGGRKNNDLILSPGQVPEYYYRKKTKKAINYSDPDLPILDDNRKSYKKIVVGYGNRIPSEKKRYGKKNKSRNPW